MTQQEIERIEHDTAAMRDVFSTRRRSAEAVRRHHEETARRARRRTRLRGLLYVLRGVVAFAVLAASVLGLTLQW